MTAGCFLYDKDYYGNDYKWDDLTSSPEECQKLCQDADVCVQFTWGKNSKACHLKHIINSSPGALVGYISGPKYCGKHSFWPNGYK